ncbi:MAG: sel1 repeat family protein [Proteobacteria bacterium]|nr:MAG: sel1 repeat family protein [Pseudomonadota bacterium]
MQNVKIPAVCSLPEMKEWMESAAEKNEGYAHWKLALSYIDGNFGEPSLSKAAWHLRAAIRLGVAFAPYCLAQLILSGQVAREVDESLSGLYETGAILGHLPSMREAARIFMTKAVEHKSELTWARQILKQAEWNGCKVSAVELRFIDALNIGVNSSRGETFLFAKRSAGEGNAAAMRCFGLMLINGYASDADEKQGVLILEEAVKRGSREASIELYQYAIDHKSYTVPETVKSAFESLLKSSCPEAHYLLALRYLDTSEPLSNQMAKDHLEKAMRFDYSPAFFKLATLEWDVTDSARRDKAIRLCLKAIHLGLGHSAIVCLGHWAQSLVEFNKASDPRLLSFIEAGAQFDSFLGLNAGLYYSGMHDTPANHTKKLFWLSAAILDGHPEASRILAIELTSEENTDGNNEALALQFLAHSALMDNSWSCAILGDMYKSGRESILKNPTQAAYWYHRGAILGYQYCHSKLSWCYANGYGVTKDLEKSAYWGEISDNGMNLDENRTHPAFDDEATKSEGDEGTSDVIPFRLKRVP